jgi:hypothetical protein
MDALIVLVLAGVPVFWFVVARRIVRETDWYRRRRKLQPEPKVVPEVPSAPQGWYHDSGDPGIVRWWDGTRWTSLTKRTGAAATPPSPGGI